jgi:hypothetical protein
MRPNIGVEGGRFDGLRRLSILFFTLAFLLHGFGLASDDAQASTVVAGPITTDTTWDTLGSPYLVTGGIVVVEENATLTINPGVEVRFDLSAGLRVLGELRAVGTSDARIRLTANTSSPFPAYWWGIEAWHRGRVTMAWFNLTFALEAIEFLSSNNTIRDCEISQSYRAVGIGSGGNLTTSGPVTNNTVERCYMHDNPSPPGLENLHIREGPAFPSYGHIIRDNVFENNENNDIYIWVYGRNRIENNTFIGGPSNGPARAIWLDFSWWNFVA